MNWCSLWETKAENEKNSRVAAQMEFLNGLQGYFCLVQAEF